MRVLAVPRSMARSFERNPSKRSSISGSSSPPLCPYSHALLTVFKSIEEGLFGQTLFQDYHSGTLLHPPMEPQPVTMDASPCPVAVGRMVPYPPYDSGRIDHQPSTINRLSHAVRNRDADKRGAIVPLSACHPGDIRPGRDKLALSFP